MIIDHDRFVELESLEERLDSEMNALRDVLSEVENRASDIAWELDDYLAEYHFSMVEESIDQLAELVGVKEIDDLKLLSALARIRNDTAQVIAPEGNEIPTLSKEQLPRGHQMTLATVCGMNVSSP